MNKCFKCQNANIRRRTKQHTDEKSERKYGTSWKASKYNSIEIYENSIVQFHRNELFVVNEALDYQLWEFVYSQIIGINTMPKTMNAKKTHTHKLLVFVLFCLTWNNLWHWILVFQFEWIGTCVCWLLNVCMQNLKFLTEYFQRRFKNIHWSWI